MKRILAAMSCLLLAFGAVATPSASAQSTETTEVLESGETLIVNTLVTNGGNASVVTERLIAADGCSEIVTTTTETVVGDVSPVAPVDEYEGRGGIQPDQPTLVTTVTTEENDLVCSPPLTDDPDEVLGEVILAVTGSDIDTPIAIGAMLLGAGGLFVAASKKRRTDQS